MKKILLIMINLSIISLLHISSYAFEMSGLQPSNPNGIFRTFSANSLSKGMYSIEFALERSNEPNFYKFSLKSAYGLTDCMELNINIPYIAGYMGSTEGWEDISIGLKHRFFEENKYGHSLSYLIYASFSNGNYDFTTDGGAGLGLIASKRIGPFYGHLNLLYTVPGDRNLKKEIQLAGGVEMAVSHNFSILAEAITKRSHFSGSNDIFDLNFGYRIRTTEYILTTIGIGAELKKREPEYRLMFSVNFSKPQKRQKIKKIFEEE